MSENGKNPDQGKQPIGSLKCDDVSYSEPRHIAELEEARGLLQDVSCADGYTLASFEWGSAAFPEEMREQLAGMIGRTVAVLRFEGRYRYRTV